jgi:hypothetical protein
MSDMRRTDAAPVVRAWTRTCHPRQFPPVGPWVQTEVRSWEDVALLVAGLDGDTRTEVSLGRAPGPHPGEAAESVGLEVCGGARGRVLVLFISPDEDGLPRPSCLVDPTLGDAPESQEVGPRRMVLPARWWVARDVAISAALTFFHEGRRDETLRWEPYPGPLETRAR